MGFSFRYRFIIIIFIGLLITLFKYNGHAQDFFGYSGKIIGSGGTTPSFAPLTVTVNCSPTVGPASVSVPLTTSCISVPTGGTLPYTFTWVWGDGTANGTTQNANHNFTTAAIDTITFTVNDNASHTVSLIKTVFTTGSTYYVAKTGNDSNNGTTISTPFLTLTRCQTAMQGGSIKVCTINDSGTYTLGANLTFTTADNNETWVAGFGQTPIIDEASSFAILNGVPFGALGANNWTWEGFKFQNMGKPNGNWGGFFTNGQTSTIRWNTYTNCQAGCISAQQTSNSLIDSNTLNGQIFGALTGGAGINIDGSASATVPISNNTVSHNSLNNIQAFGIVFGTSSTGGAMKNNIMDRNLLTNTNTACNDCGALYTFSHGTTTNTGNQITNNSVFNNNTGSTNATKSIYLDDNSSGTTVSGNICNKCGTYATFNHCGKNNIVTNNIFDVSIMANDTVNGATSVSGYQDDSICGTGNENGNTNNHNIIYRSGIWGFTAATGLNCGLWLVTANTGGDTLPSISANTYWSPTGNAPNPSGCDLQLTDSSPTNANPLFKNPANNDYTMANTPSGFIPLVTNRGPINSPYQSAGSIF